MKVALPLLLVVLALGGCVQTQTATKTSPMPPKATGASSTRPPIERAERGDVYKSRSRDGRFEATGTLLREPKLHGSVEVRDLKTARAVVAWPVEGGVTGLSFSPGGHLLVVNSPNHVEVWTWKSKQRVHEQGFDTSGGQYRIRSAFSPDGRQLAVTFGSLAVIDVGAWKTRQFPQLGDPAFVDDATWSPNGRLLALSQHDLGAFSLVDVRSGRVGALKGIDAQSEPLFSGDSRWMAGATANSGTFIWKVENGATTPIGGDFHHPLFPVAFSKDARFLVCRDEKGRVGVWRTLDGKRIVNLHTQAVPLETLFERMHKLG